MDERAGCGAYGGIIAPGGFDKMEKSEMMEQIRKIETALSVELPEVVVRYLLQR